MPEPFGNPFYLYDNPVNVFVGAFLGSPSRNLLERAAGGEDTSTVRFPDGDALRLQLRSSLIRLPYAFAPERFSLGQEPKAGHLRAVVVEPTGASTELVVHKAGQNIIVLSHDHLTAKPGDITRLTPDAGRTQAFPSESSAT